MNGDLSVIAASLAAAAASLMVEARVAGGALSEDQAVARAHQLYESALSRLTPAARPRRPNVARHPVSPEIDAGVALTVLASRNPAEMLGQVIDDRYRIDYLLGRGGMGIVYAATRLAARIDQEQTVAVKLLIDVMRSAGAWRHFLQEALASQRITHPSVVRVQDVVDNRGLRALVLDFAPGITLRKRLEAGRLGLGDAVGIVSQAADAVAAAHDSDVLHNDLKPENLMVEEQAGTYRVRVLDFGLSVVNRLDAHGNETAMRAVAGTPEYMAPEQFEGRVLDARADVYALSTILYECLTGHHPFSGLRSISALVARKVYGERIPPPSTHDARIPATLDALVLAGLEPDRERRLESARELLARLTIIRV